MIIRIDFPRSGALVEALKKAAPKALNYAQRDALNAIAYTCRTEYAQRAKGAFTMRNSFTERSIRFDKAERKGPNSMVSRAGSTVPWMARREDDAVETSGKSAVAIPVAGAAGQTGTQRTRAVRRPNYMGAITLNRAKARNPTGGKRQANAVAMRLAAKGSKVAYLETAKGAGLFRVTMRGRKKFSVRLLYDLSHKSVRTPGKHLLEQSAQLAAKAGPKLFETQLKKQLARARVPGF